jgi:bis(5'-nucleosyl)-tetraphosphatase (symmetrical)
MIGDLHGCYQPLKQLLAHPALSQEPTAQLWFAGDIVNRGPLSLETLRCVMALEKQGAVVVLGNHDLHLLGVAAGVRQLGKSDTLEDILNAPDLTQLLDWLRSRPLAHFKHGHLLVHAGVLPSWDVAKTLALAAEVQAALRAENWQHNLQKMFGNEPTQWEDHLLGRKRLRVIINALTRMRLCTPTGQMEHITHGRPAAWPAGYLPWFDIPNRAIQDATVVFGHWAAQGLLIRDDIICLDSGCVWGRCLTALRLQDKQLIQINCDS